MYTLQPKRLWQMLMLTVAMSFVSTPLRSQVVGISGVNTPLTPVCSGEDFTVTFNYYWASFPSPTGLQEIEVTVPVPAGLQPAANSNTGGINPTHGTVTYIPNASAPTSIVYKITSDLTIPSGGGTVQVNLRFPLGVTCNGDKKCFSATSRYKQNGVWSTPKSTPDTFCVTAKAFNNWSVDKDVMWCKWDDSARSVLYRITVQNNTQANNWDPTCSINIPTYTLTDVIGPNATFGGIVTSLPGFANSNFVVVGVPGSTVTFTLPGGGGLNVNDRYYYVYFWVRYPNSFFNNITSVTNRVNLNATDTCKNVVRLSDSVRADLCKYLNQGLLSKTFTQTIGTPPNPTYFPNLSPGCCGAYSLAYKNTGTINQPNLIITERIPDNVNFSSVRTVITEPGMNCDVRYSTDNGLTYPFSIGTYTTVNTSGHVSLPIPTSATNIQWTYTGTALPVGYTLTNHIAFCVRSDYSRGNLQANDVGGNNIVESGETIRNIASASQFGATIATFQLDLTVSPIAPKIVAHKMFIGNCVGGVSSSGGPWYPGQTVRYRMAIANIGSQTAANCVITDLLPQYLSYVGNPTYVWYRATSIPGVSKSRPPCDTIPVLANTTAAVGAISVNTAPWGNQQRVTWNFPTLPNDCDGFPSYLIIDFDVKIQGPVDPALAGRYCNTYNFAATEVPAPGHNSNEVCFIVTGDPQFVGDKSVGLSPNGPWSTSASIAAGQQGYYKIKIKNTGNMPLAQLSLLDIFPHVGDRSLLGYGNVSNYVSRNSSYGISLSGPIQYVTGSNITSPDFTVKYTTTTDAPTAIKRSDLGLHFPFLGAPNVDPIGAVSSIPTWTTTFPAGAKAFTLEVNPGGGHPILAPSEYLEILAPFTVDGNAGNDSIACNSFAYQAKPTGLQNYNGGVLVSEKGPVCVSAIADSCNFLCNGDFEIFNGVVTGFEWLSEDSVDCWETTASDNNIEIWNENGMPFAAYSGTYYAEINATQTATLYQTFTLPTAKTISVSFAHRGRYPAPDVMKVSIAPIPSGPSIALGTYSDDSSAWGYYTTAAVSLPAGTYRLQFESVSSGGNDSAGGNFIDSVSVQCADEKTDANCCDSARFIPYAHDDVNEDVRTVEVTNVKHTPIAWIGIEYYKNCGTVASSPTAPYPTSLNLGGLKATWTGIPFTYPGSWFTIINKHRAPNVPNSLCTTPIGYTGSYQDKVMFNIGMSAYDPDTWCIKLVVHHCDSSICTIDLPVFDPDTATSSSAGVIITPDSNTVRWVRMTLDGKQFKNEDVRYIVFTPRDTLDKIVGGTGGMFESAHDIDTKTPITSFVQSPGSALFGLRRDSLGGSFNVFVATRTNPNRPILDWKIYNGSGKPLSKGSVEASSTVSIVEPPMVTPGTSDVSINSIIQNPASGSVMFNYTLGASEAVRIELFDPLGRSVGIITDGFQTQGSHQINYHVGTLAEGTYYLRLTTRYGKASAVVKVIH
jgi:uncharacterized repeat protein (TIGR01451 family)